jgi:hypothetical protein
MVTVSVKGSISEILHWSVATPVVQGMTINYLVLVPTINGNKLSNSRESLGCK